MPNDLDLSLLSNVLEQQRIRAEFAAQFLSEPITYPSAESAALQMRQILELIPLGALVVHRELVEQVVSAYQRKQPDEAAKLIKNVNPDYWPKPQIEILTPAGPGVARIEPIEDGFVREDEWQREWGFLSSVLHARNPYVGDPNLTGLHSRLVELHGRLIRLLGLYWLDLPTEGQRVRGQLLASDGHGRASLWSQLPTK